MKHIIRLFILIAALVLGTDHAWADAVSNPRVNFVYVEGDNYALNSGKGIAFASDADQTGQVTITVTINEGQDFRCIDGDLTAEQSINSGNAEARTRTSGEGLGKGVPVPVNFEDTNEFTLTLPEDESTNVTVYVKFSEKLEFNPEVTIEDWPYGETANEPSLKANPSSDDVTYTYADAEEGTYTETVPTQAGPHWVKASVAATADYKACESQPVSFTIAKAPLTIKAKDHGILYGNAAANNGVTYSDFVNNENESCLSGTLTYTYSYDANNDNHKPGIYEITPSGLTSNNYAITFVPGTLTVTSVPVRVSVVDVANGEEIEGATVQVLDGENVVKDLEGNNVEWTSGKETHTINVLKAGKTYTLHETVAPDGYILSSDDTFTIDENGDITYTGTMTDNNVLLVENSKTKVEISVVDIANGEELAGAYVQVIKNTVNEVTGENEETFVREWYSTTENYTIEGLKTGVEYTLRETVAPEGYTIPADYTFTIDETGQITSTGSVTPDGVLLVENTKTRVEVSVVDVANGATLEGATIQVKDSDGNIVEEWISTADDTDTEDVNESLYVIEGLKTGVTYALCETVAPDGYLISSDDTFTIDENGDITYTGTMTDNNVLLVENSKTKVVVSVVDAADGEALADATVQIIDSNGDIVKEWVSSADDTATSDVNESLHVIEGLKTGEEYTLSETVAPDGYVLSSDNTFTIATDGTITFSGSTTTDDEGNTVLLVKNIMLTSATLKIVWDDNNNQDGKRPTEMTATLSDGSEVTLNLENSWTATVENLPMYNDDGDEITYTWTPGTLPDGYMMTDTTEDGVTTTVTLTRVSVYEITEADGITDAISDALKGKTVNIAFSRTFEKLSDGEGKASTLCLPFDLDKPSTTDVGTFYTFGGVSSDATGEYVVTMIEETADNLSAGTPYMFKPATTATEAISFQNTAYTVPDDGFTPAGKATANGWEFIGTYQEKTWPKEQTETRLYGFAASNFEKSDGTLLNEVGAFRRFNYGHINPFRCYLMAPESLGVRGMSKAGNQLPESMKVVLISANGTTTAIGTLDTRTGEVTFDGEWYDLNGRRLNGKPTQKGVYIHNGHKVAIK